MFERTETLNKELNPGTKLVGIRIPDYDFVRQLAVACQEPLALTSANRSATKSSLETKVCVSFVVQFWKNNNVICIVFKQLTKSLTVYATKLGIPLILNNFCSHGLVLTLIF